MYIRKFRLQEKNKSKRTFYLIFGSLEIELTKGMIYQLQGKVK